MVHLIRIPGYWSHDVFAPRKEAKTMTKLSEYMFIAEAAEYRGVHNNTIRNWAFHGDIPMHRNPANGYRLFKRSDLDKFLKMVAKPATTTQKKPK